MQTKNLSRQDAIKAIEAAFDVHDRDRIDVPKSQVLEWMLYSDLEVQGALYSMIADTNRAKYIAPRLDTDDYFRFVLPYLEECVLKDPTGAWVDSRYVAGRQLVAWIIHFWNDKRFSRERLVEIKSRLADMYERGADDVRNGVVNGVLEHLFENRELRVYFEDWKDHPILGAAYKRALAWSEPEQR